MLTKHIVCPLWRLYFNMQYHEKSFEKPHILIIIKGLTLVDRIRIKCTIKSLVVKTRPKFANGNESKYKFMKETLKLDFTT